MVSCLNSILLAAPPNQILTQSNCAEPLGQQPKQLTSHKLLPKDDVRPPAVSGSGLWPMSLHL